MRSIVAGCTMALAVLFLAGEARADLMGTTVSGDLIYYTFPTYNWFDPVNGLVPSGYGNSIAGPVVTVDAGTEFGFSDPGNTVTVNLTGTTLTITDICKSGSSPAFTIKLTDASFGSVTKTSNTFLGSMNPNLVGSTLEIDNFSSIFHAGTYVATYDVTVVTPEPASLSLFALAGAAALVRRRRRW